MKRLIAIVALACLAVGVAWLVPSMGEGAGKPATVRLTAEDLTAQFTLDKAGKLMVTSKGTPLPPGTYTIKSLSVFKKDDKGKVWELRYVTGTGDKAGATLIVDEEQDKIVDPGPPVSFQGWCRQGDPPKQDNVRLGFGAHGRYGGLMVQPMAYVGGRPAPGPAFKLVTPEGKVIHQAAFSVASSTGALSYDWRPGAFKGKYKIEIAATFGPFEWKQSSPETLFEVK